MEYSPATQNTNLNEIFKAVRGCSLRDLVKHEVIRKDVKLSYF